MWLHTSNWVLELYSCACCMYMCNTTPAGFDSLTLASFSATCAHGSSSTASLAPSLTPWRLPSVLLSSTTGWGHWKLQSSRKGGGAWEDRHSYLYACMCVREYCNWCLLCMVESICICQYFYMCIIMVHAYLLSSASVPACLPACLPAWLPSWVEKWNL